MYTCPKCKTVLKCKSGYLQHMDGHFIKSKKNIPCPICKLGLGTSRRTFYDHMKTHSPQKAEPEKTLYCRHCDKSFLTKKAIEEHFQTFDKNVNVPCPFCKSKNLPSFIAYKTHKTRWVASMKSSFVYFIASAID